jgi:ketosteroid isomerase-like protein
MSAQLAHVDSTITSHLEAFFQKSVEGVVRDYTEQSVLIVPNATLRGLSEIRRFFADFIGGLPAGFLESFKLHRKELAGDVGYIVWEASPWVSLATDTFVVRDGKIMMQTFAAYPPLS